MPTAQMSSWRYFSFFYRDALYSRTSAWIKIEGFLLYLSGNDAKHITDPECFNFAPDALQILTAYIIRLQPLPTSCWKSWKWEGCSHQNLVRPNLQWSFQNPYGSYNMQTFFPEIRFKGKQDSLCHTKWNWLHEVSMITKSLIKEKDACHPNVCILWCLFIRLLKES